MSLPGGIAASFEPGFLSSAANVTLSTSDAAEPYPPGFDNYQPGTPVAPSTSVTFPASALARIDSYSDQPSLHIKVPAAVPSLQGEERLLAEVHLYLSDGQHIFSLEPYARVEGEYGQTFEGTDTVSVRTGQLVGQGNGATDTVRVTVRPVRLGGEQLTNQALPEGFVRETVAGNLDGGVAFDFAPDGRIFIAEKKGVVKVYQDGRVRSTPFVNMTAQVNNISDRGMLGIAVHPQFPQQPYVYVLYTYDPPEVQGKSGLAGPDGGGARVARLVRLTADAAQDYNVAEPGSDVVLLGKNSTYANIGDPAARNSDVASCGRLEGFESDCLPVDELSHTIGTVKFGKDGSLFVSNGDGASFNNVQEYATRALDIYSLSGKLLRINPLTGHGYASNPFYDGNPESNRSKVYSYGLRNPFRFALEPGTGEPFIGDVGWNTWEEINTGYGRNFGWPCYEGGNGVSLQQGGYRAIERCAANYSNPWIKVPPLYAYDHMGGGSSVQIGDFYTGTRYPATYQGALFFSDINQGWIKYLKLSGDGSVTVSDFASDTQGIVQMSAGPLGDLYTMDIYGGSLTRLRYTPGSAVPLAAKMSASPLQGDAPLDVAFSSDGSTGTGALLYTWNFGDGSSSGEANPVHTFAEAGVYQVSLRVTDDSGDSANASLQVRVSNGPPTATILSPADGASYTVGDVIPFSGSGTDPEQGDLPEEALLWTVKMHHNDHVHLDGLPPTVGAAGSFEADDHGDNTHIELCLAATDQFNESGTSCVTLRPRTVAYTLDTVPTGLELPWEGTLRRTPFTVTTHVNARQQLIAPAQQGAYTFASWSDGGSAEHYITVGSDPVRLVATYAGSEPKRDQTVRFTSSSPRSAKVGDTYTARAVASSGLSVSFSSTTSSVCSVSGNRVRLLAAGTCTVAASQTGDDVYNPAPVVTQTFSVRAVKRQQTVRFTSSPPRSARVGNTYTARAVASSGLSVSFSSTTSRICSVSGNRVRAVRVGTCVVYASQLGNSTYYAAVPAVQSFKVAR